MDVTDTHTMLAFSNSNLFYGCSSMCALFHYCCLHCQIENFSSFLQEVSCEQQKKKKSFPFWMSACSHTDRTHRHTDRQKHCKQKKNAQKTRHLRCWRLFPSPFHWRPKSTFHHHSFILQWITPLPVIEFNHLFNRRWA